MLSALASHDIKRKADCGWCDAGFQTLATCHHLLAAMSSEAKQSAEPHPNAEAHPTDTPASPSRVPLNCAKAFDSLYFCYSPFHQARQYYITGHLDDCKGRLKRFRMCVMSRFRAQSDSELLYEQDEVEEKKKKGLHNVKPVWEFRQEYLDNVKRAEREESEQQNQEQNENQSAWWL